VIQSPLDGCFKLPRLKTHLVPFALPLLRFTDLGLRPDLLGTGVLFVSVFTFYLLLVFGYVY